VVVVAVAKIVEVVVVMELESYGGMVIK